MQHNEYDIGAAFKAIEDELIKSMIRNMDRHRAEETKEGIEWSMWQAEQLKALEKYKRDNRKRYGKQFQNLNKEIGELIRISRQKGNMQQEIQILNAIRKGFPARKISKGATAEFFKLNERKLEALIEATTHDMEAAETAVLRKANDDYRKAIFNAQVYANTGAGTYEKAVDMATRDMLSRGLNCVEYANGARHTLADYADMAIRTASKRAYLQGEGEKRQEWGITTVIVNKRGNPCPKCLPFVGKILIDDVWSGGKKSDGPYPLMSKAIKAGLYHPRCKDSHTTYFPGISTADDTWTKEELESIGQANKQEAEQQHAERQHEKFERLAKYSLDEENQEKYGLKADMWKTARFKTGGMGSRKYVDSKQPLGNFHAVPKEQAVNILRRDSEEWIALLTDAEKKAVKKYTYNSGDKRPNRFFERLNAMLRGDLPDDEKLKNYAGTISGALKKRRLQYDVVCYRNASINPIGDRPPGSIVKLKQFTSTSVIPSRTLKGKCEIVIYAPKGTAGAYIEKLSSFPDQRELLLDKDCCYRVKSNQGNKIELEVLP
ncbi:MAG: phage minor capsid protein [Enterocloster bolteae]|uniref:phage minor capsid protein n=1 Tax=Enterocloster bolteae TaxID=208479 RepID=UPI0039956975